MPSLWPNFMPAAAASMHARILDIKVVISRSLAFLRVTGIITLWTQFKITTIAWKRYDKAAAYNNPYSPLLCHAFMPLKPISKLQAAHCL